MKTFKLIPLTLLLVSSGILANTGKPPKKKDRLSYPTADAPAESPQGVKTQTSVSAPQYREVIDTPAAMELFDKARSLFASNATQEASVTLQNYLKQFPQGQFADVALIQRGKLALSSSNFTEADVDFNKVIQMNPPSRIRGEAYLGLARSRYNQGLKKEALGTLGKIDSREVGPSEKQDLFGFWAKVADEEGKMLESVLASLKFMKDASPQDRKRSEADVEKKVRDYLNESELNFLFREYPATFPVPVVQLRLGMIQLAKGNQSSAKNIFSSVINGNPGSKYANQAQALLTRADSAQSIIPNKIGLLIPQTGPFAAVGKKFQEGLMLSLEKQAPQIEWVVVDPGPNPDTASSAFEKLVFEERVVAVIGPFSASQIEAVGMRASEFGVPYLTLSARDPMLERSASIFRMGMTPAKQVRALVGYAKERLGATRFAILFPEDSFGREYASEYFKVVEEMGSSITAAESYSPNQSDFLVQIQNMTGTAFPGFRRTEAQEMLQALEQKLARPANKKEMAALRVPPIVDFDVLFLPDTYRAVGQIAPALIYGDVTNVKLMGPSSWNNYKLLERAGQFLENALFVDFFSPDRSSKVTKYFIDAYQKKYSSAPDSMAGAGYDLGLSLALAFQKGKPETRDELRSHLETLGSVEGALGIYKWDSRRDALSELQVFSIRRNSFQHQGGVLLKND